MHPGTLVVIIGIFRDAASTKTVERPSLYDGKIKQSAESYNDKTLDTNGI